MRDKDEVCGMICIRGELMYEGGIDKVFRVRAG